MVKPAVVLVHEKIGLNGGIIRGTGMDEGDLAGVSSGGEDDLRLQRNHVPGLQYFVRIMLVTGFLLYRQFIPEPLWLDKTLAVVFLCTYGVVQVFLRYLMIRNGHVWKYIRSAIIADLVLGYCVWLYEPHQPAALQMFLLIVIVGNALQYGLKAFRILGWSVLLVAPFVLAYRIHALGWSLPEAVQFALSLIVLLYMYKFIHRIEIFRKETKERTLALEISNKKYMNIFENTGAGLLVIDEDLIVSEANPMMEKMTGYTREEIEGRFRWIDFVEKEDMKVLKNAFRQRMKTGAPPPREYEFRLVRKDRGIIDVFCEVNSEPKTGKTIASVIDITLRKKAESALQKAHDELEKRVEGRTAELKKTNSQLKKAMEAADASAKAKSEFLANMSHEIRTPMNAIIGMCDLVMNTDMTLKQREYLSIVRSSSRSLLELINDILDFSKIDAGKLGFENIPFNLRSMIEDVSDMFLERIMTKDIELIVDIDQNAPLKLVSDPLRLRQVLANLTSNAFKFTKKGEISIAVKPLEKEGDSVTLLFSVRDTGIGIDPVMSERLFDAFAQADGSTTRKYGGTGLGLAICKKIVSMMGGDIWLESGLGKGSTFYFTIEARMPLTDSDVPKRLPPSLKNRKILIVDDNPSTLMIIKRYTDSFGFRADLANTAETALQLYHINMGQDPYSLIIMDVQLPGMDGIEAVSRIKADPRYTSPPMICMGGYNQNSDVQKARMAGAESFLMKPVKQSILFDTIMEIFGFRAVKIRDTSHGLKKWDEFNDIRVLLVEDNAINQMVAREILESVGITVDKVNNGLEAIDALRRNGYDMVLMDVQMPEMDGLEASKYIREHLRLDTPIIAMTAHAMYGDRERCLVAGMNDYVPKPIDRQELFAAIRNNLSLFGGTPGDEIPRRDIVIFEPEEETVYTLPGLDVGEGLRRLGGNWEKYREIVGEFCRTFESAFNEFTELVKKGNFTDARLVAHSLKGASGNISAVELKTVSGSLEQACVKKNPERMLTLIQAARDAFLRVAESYGKIDGGKDDHVHLVDPGEPVDPERLLALFKELGESLRESDPVRSETCFNEIRNGILNGSFNRELEDLGRMLERQVVEYNFDEAEVTLKTLDRKLKKQLGF